MFRPHFLAFIRYSFFTSTDSGTVSFEKGLNIDVLDTTNYISVYLI